VSAALSLDILDLGMVSACRMKSSRPWAGACGRRGSWSVGDVVALAPRRRGREGMLEGGAVQGSAGEAGISRLGEIAGGDDFRRRARATTM